jgi:phage gp45-like
MSLHRTHARWNGNLAMHGSGRGTLRKVDDSKLMQEVEIGMYADQTKTKVEHPHEYGFTSVPKTDDDSQGTRPRR